MQIKFLDNTISIREKFTKRFIMSWDEFQIKQKDLITEMAKTKHPINKEWYEQSFMWDRMNPDFNQASMKDALEYLQKQCEKVFFMSENEKQICYQDKKYINFIAEADAEELATQIEHEWYASYILTAQNMYDENAFLPEDLYVFDSSLKWCVVFTHETTDWESEIDNPLKAAESRICIICEI